jgi:hypothetical protein
LAADLDDSDSSDIQLPKIIPASVPSPNTVPTNMSAHVDEAQKCFQGVTFQAPTEDMVHRNDFLLPILGGRLLEVKNTRLPPERRDNLTMGFMTKNLERLSQLAILSGAIVDNLAEVNPDST